MRGWSTFAIAALGALALSSPAWAAEIAIVVDKTAQRMTVSVDGQERYVWPVSTGMGDYATPSGASRRPAWRRCIFPGMGQRPHAAFYLLYRCRPRHPRQPCHGPPRDAGLPWLRAVGARERQHPVQPRGGSRNSQHQDRDRRRGARWYGLRERIWPEGRLQPPDQLQPLTSGIMAGGDTPRLRSETRPKP